MRIETQRVTCKSCGTVSDLEVVLDAPLEVVSASMAALFCPACTGSSSELRLGGELPGKPTTTHPLADRLSWWMVHGDSGLSSYTIAAALCRQRYDPSRATVPLDPDDFRRCKMLLDLIPEWRGRLHEVAGRFPIWQPFADAWAELEALWDEESPRGLCPKLYQRIQQLCAEGQNQ